MTIKYTTPTISVLASDGSLNDSGGGFITAGFGVGDLVSVSGFLWLAPQLPNYTPNNVTDVEILTLTASKMTLDATLVDASEGDEITIYRKMDVTYPVAPESRWSTWSIADAEIKQHNKPWPRADGMEIVGLDLDVVPLLEVQTAQPVYDPATHYIARTEPVVDVNANTHTHGWEVLPRPQEDIDADTEREQAKALYTALKNGTGTQLERLERTEKVCAYLLKHLFGAS